jgi:hypothetical protein
LAQQQGSKNIHDLSNAPSTQQAQSALAGQKLLDLILESFGQIQDPRVRQSAVKHELADVLSAAFAMFAFKYPSLLKFETEVLEDQIVRENLSSLFRMSDVPSDTQMREILDDVMPDELRPVFKQLIQLATQSKALLPFRFLEDKYLIPLDGTGFFSSSEIHCSSCLVRSQRKNTEKLYQHQLVSAAIVSPDQKTVIPLFPEPVGRNDGEEKNDCERNAFKRWVTKFREDYPRLPAILVTDAIGASIPQIEQLRYANLSYILSVKPGSQKTLFRSVKGMAKRGEMKKHVATEVIGQKVKKKITRTYYWVNGALLSNTDPDFSVNFVDFTEKTEWVCKGKRKVEKVHFSFITDFHLTQNNIEKIVQGGRARWKIENETFNTLKNKGYHFEHNYGHGYKSLSNLLATLMMLVFLFDQLQELGCKLFNKALSRAKRRSYLWPRMLSTIQMVRISSWEMLMSLIAFPNSYELKPAPK